jgi:hypothetical protein
MFTAGAADWVVVGDTLVVNVVVGGAWCCVEWQPDNTAPSKTMLASLRVPIKAFHHTSIGETLAWTSDSHGRPFTTLRI